MRTILLLTICTPVLLTAQVAKVEPVHVNYPIVSQVTEEGSRILWVENLNWQQVLKKAKAENKYIFVDCFTTWCGPCKKMEKEVYSHDSVAALFNNKFISVKLQMDSAKGDDENTRSWYATARKIATDYHVAEYPTYLFFSPAGEVVYKAFGFKQPDQFIQVAKDALTPSKQYYALLNAYKKGKRDYAHMPDLISLSKQLGDSINYLPLLTDYYAYLQSLGKDKLYTKENIDFIASTISRSSQSPFSLFYPDGKAVDEVMHKTGYAKKVVDHVITKEKINPFLRAAEGKPEPDWSILYNNIAKDYNGDYADRNVMEAKMTWYYFYSDMLNYGRTLNDKIEKYGTDTTSKGEDFILNNKAFLIWEKVTDVKELKRMTNWMAGVARRGEKQTDYYLKYWPLYLDTYANLLYKIGDTKEALKWEEKAVIKSKELDISKGDIRDIQTNYDKMKKGEPTWPTETK